MSVERQKLEEIFNQLPEELQVQVLAFAEFLLKGKLNGSRNGAVPAVSSFFGIWDSGDAHSADNDRIDRDLTHEYTNTHTRE
jgi:hypothetical protein